MKVFWLIFLLSQIVIGHDRLHCPPTQSFSSELTSGEFKSPGFPNRYINELHCVYEIEPFENWGVILNIEFFQTENLHDTVEIYQTYNYNNELYATKHAVLSGIDIPQHQYFSQINGGIRIVFNTDLSEANFPGFKMSFKRFHPSGYPFANFDPCPEVFHMANQTKNKLPYFAWRYSPRNSCVFQVNSTESVEIQVDNVKPNVKIDIYEAENFGTIGRGMSPLKSYNGFQTTGFPGNLVSRSGSFIIIISLMSTLADFSSAFNITYQQVKNPCSCPNTEIALNYTEIEYNSPGWPLEYCDNLACVTNFKVADGLSVKSDQFQSVLVKFKSFNVESIHDLFELYSGSRKLKLLTPYDELAPNIIGYFTFPDTNAIINFTTDISITAPGFSLDVKLISRPKECKCPDESDVVEASGSLKYTIPKNCGYMDCFWTLIPPKTEASRYRIAMIVLFNVGSWSEFIEISADHQMGPSLNTVRLTPSMIPLNESGAGKFISLHSDQPVQLWYHREDESPESSPNPGIRDFRIHYRWAERCKCGDLELIANENEWSLLQSPDYPTPYCDDMNCTYVVSAPEGLVVSVNVTFLDLEYNMDTLSFYDGPTLNHSRLDLLTGIEYMSNDIESTDNQMTICFSSDLSISGKGYKLLYTAKKLKSEDESGGFGFFKVFLLFAFISSLVVGSIYVLKKYEVQTGITLPSFPSFQLNTFENQRFTSSLNSLIRSNNDLDNNHI